MAAFPKFLKLTPEKQSDGSYVIECTEIYEDMVPARPPGNWLKQYGQWDDGYGWRCICSECKRSNMQLAPRYCPNCGSRNGGIIE